VLGDKISCETVYLITSLPANEAGPGRLLALSPAHALRGRAQPIREARENFREDRPAAIHALGDDRELLAYRPAPPPLHARDHFDPLNSRPSDVTMVDTMVKTVSRHGEPASMIVSQPVV
jgi:hypothetical protein